MREEAYQKDHLKICKDTFVRCPSTIRSTSKRRLPRRSQKKYKGMKKKKSTKMLHTFDRDKEEKQKKKK